jgi:heptosyltransferase-2
VITLFGPTHIAWSETYDERAEHLQLKLDCGPCQQRECPLKHHRCLRDFSVDTVFASVKRQLNRHQQRRYVA